MQIRTLDSNFINWQLTGHYTHAQLQNKSSLHSKARDLIKQAYPTMQILEEVPIPLRKGEILYLDFYLPLPKICFEVHGEQHYKFVPFYHGNVLNFSKSLKRDREKHEWCSLNNINCIILPFDQIDGWQGIIKNDNN